MPDICVWKCPSMVFVVFFTLNVGIGLQGKPLKIVGLFDKTSNHLKTVFASAIVNANDQREFNHDHLQGVPLDVDTSLSVYWQSEQLCQVLKTGVVAVVAVHQSTPEDYAQSICDTLEVPLLDCTGKNPLAKESLFLSLHPHGETLAGALLDLVNSWKWTSFAIFYEDSEGNEHLRKYTKFFAGITAFRVTIRQLEGDNFHSVLREIKNTGENKLIMDCGASTARKVLRQAQQLGLTAPGFHYVLTTLDVHTLDLSTFIHDQAVVTAFQLIDLNATEKYSDMAKRRPSPTDKMTAKEALLFDTITLISAALKNVTGWVKPYPVDCETASGWDQGSVVFNEISHTEMEGLTRTIKFDSRGLRSNLYFDIIQVTPDGLINTGHWTEKDGIKLGPRTGTGSIKGKRLRAIAVIDPPYVKRKVDHETLVGNEKYEGYAVDLMDRIAELLNFTYTLEEKTGSHAVYNDTSKMWSGLVGELIAKRGDIAVGGITINHQREEVVDFTKPFMYLGISILYRAPTSQPPDLFSFLHPFSPDVWLNIILAAVTVSIVTFLMARFSPYEWYNPHPCDAHLDVVENQFTIGNCLWFTMGSLMQQGSDVSPKAVSTRVLAGCWWFFTMIMIASYTANLAAFLATNPKDQPIKNVDDLAGQTKIKYGCYGGGATYRFFQDSKHPTYQKMFEFMILDKSNNIVTSTPNKSYTTIAIEKVLKEEYAYFMESPSLEYEVNEKCGKLTQIGGLLDSKGYGFATQQNSPYRDEISRAILRLQENSELQLIKDKWWKKNTATCEVKPNDPSSELQLGLASVGGVFLILLGGLVVALLIAGIELAFSVRKITKITKRPFCAEFARAFVYALKMKGSSPLKLASHNTTCM